MKIINCAFLLIVLLTLSSAAAPPNSAFPVYKPSQSLVIDNTTYINANRIMMFVTNHGNFGRDLAGVFGYDYGTFFPYTGDVSDYTSGKERRSPYYAGGLWMGAKVDSEGTSEIRMAIAEYNDEYVPGPMSGGTFSPDSPQYRVYKLYRDSLASNPNQDYLDYLTYAIHQGAPFKVTDEGDTIPDMIGDQMCWSVFNDADRSQHIHDAGSTAPLGVEIRETVFAFDRQGSLGNIVFLRFQIFNKGGDTLKECYISIWSDPDLGGAGDDLVGCDTILGLGYVYNDNNADQYYGATPPCLGIDFFQGPLQATGNGADTAIMWGQKWPGYKNMMMTSFNKYINGTDPDSKEQVLNYMKGLERYGNPYVFNGDTIKFFHSGDPSIPASATNDLDIAPADRRMMQTTGPITFNPGDSTEILAAIIIGQGSDRINSIQVMKALDAFAQRVYENGFNPPKAPAKPKVTVAQLSERITLSWTDTSEVDPGDFPFEGYTVWQGESSTGPWYELATFDVINDNDMALIDTLTDAYSKLDLPVVQRALSNSGLSYTYTTTRDAIIGGVLNDVTTYYFRVSAFSFSYVMPDGSAVPKGDRFLESPTTVLITPQSPLAGVHIQTEAGDTLDVTHVGPADGSVIPLVIDPTITTGHDYAVVFSEDDELGLVWSLLDQTAGVVLIDKQVNQSGDEAYFAFDGMLVKVLGPEPGVKTGDMFDNPDDPQLWGWDIPAGTRRFTWANADGFGWEGFRGAIGWGGPGDIHGFGSNDPVPASSLPNVLLKLATMTPSGAFDENDENVSYAYRYGRGFQNPPARPEFEPYIINPESYGYQDFTKSCPLSAWNVDVEPPQRLAIGYLENNAALATLNGKYVPPESDSLAAWGTTNTDPGGPREWLWIFLDEYTTTPNPDYQLNATEAPMPIMYWLTVARRGHDVPFSPDSSGQDQFLIIPNKINTVADTFFFTAPAPIYTTNQSDLDEIKAVPNPFYLYGGYDPSPGSYKLNFHHLPEKCTITIYNLAGDYIDKIEKNDPTTAIAGWDLLTERGLPVASGIYIYVVDAPGFGQKVGKLAVFTQAEVLDLY
jgi:hypothetical protein